MAQLAREAMGEFTVHWADEIMKRFWDKMMEASRWAQLQYEVELLAIVDGINVDVHLCLFQGSVSVQIPRAFDVPPTYEGWGWGHPEDYYQEWGIYAREEARCRAEATLLLLELRDYWTASSRKNAEPWGDFNEFHGQRDESPDFYGWEMSLLPEWMHPWTGTDRWGYEENSNESDWDSEETDGQLEEELALGHALL